MGYKKKRSQDSLIASSIIAGLLLTSAYLMGKPNTTYGVRLALGIHPVALSTLSFHIYYAICQFLCTQLLPSWQHYAAVDLAISTVTTNVQCKLVVNRAHTRLQTQRRGPIQGNPFDLKIPLICQRNSLGFYCTGQQTNWNTVCCISSY